MSEGLPREEAREKIFRRVDPAIFERVLADLKDRKAIVGADRLALTTHRVSVAGADDRVRAAIIEAYRAAGLKPPDTAVVEAQAGAPKRDRREGDDAAAAREGPGEARYARVSRRRAAAAESRRDRAQNGVAGRTRDGGRRDVQGSVRVSRKFAIPLLEYLDRERVTRRTGDVRLVL